MLQIVIGPFGRGWQEYARTETLHSMPEPSFKSKIKIPYCFGEQQRIKFQLFDGGSSSPTLGKHEYLGKVECTLAEIVSSSSYSKELSLKGAASPGLLVIKAKEVNQHREELELVFTAVQLKKSGLSFSCPDPFLEILSANKTLLRRTAYLSNTRNPQWPNLSVPLRSLKNERGEYAQLNLQVFHHKGDGEHQLLGETQIHARQLLEAPAVFTLKKHGDIHLTASRMRRVHSFLEYISSGTNVHCTFAVDLTASNGDPRNPESLHFVGPQPNQYECAMKAIGDVIQDYSCDKVFSLLGFGARSTPVLHELKVKGVDSVLRAYRTCVESVQLGESRCFAAPIDIVARKAKSCTDGTDYHILVILTGGEITNVTQTIKAINEASELPMSIVFIGVGSAEFSVGMPDIDARMACHNERDADRDAVIFTSLSEFVNRDPHSVNFNMAKHALAKIPDQLVSYMKLKSIVPLAKLTKQ